LLVTFIAAGAAMPLLSTAFAPGLGDRAEAAQRRAVPKEKKPPAEAKKETPPETSPAPAATPAGAASGAAATAAPVTPPVITPPLPTEKVEADVSTRSVPIKLGFTGTEIIVFGSVDNSRQTSAEAGYYDVVITLEGQPTSLIVRRKSNVAGLWMNTPSGSFTFDRVPSYYAIASTRPLDEIAEPAVLTEAAIGFDFVKIQPAQSIVPNITEEDRKSFRDAIVRLKQKDGLYIEADYDVTFIGRSLFRTTISLPANIAVGPLDVKVYLFREGKLLSQYASRVELERAGLELWLHGFANHYPLWYGLFTVAVAMAAGLLASALFSRGAH
jgi:uncharacterized protein (TIGR02186 family)